MSRMLLSFFVCSLVAVYADQTASAQYRSLERIEYRGLKDISPDNLQSELSELPEIVEAMHPSIDDKAFQFRVHDALSRGLLSAGFLDRNVKLADPTNDATHDFAIEFVEGERFRWGIIRVKGSNEKTNDQLVQFLSNVLTDEEKETKLWKTGEPATGTLFGRLRYKNLIRAELRKLGLDADKADIRFERDDEKLVVNALIELSAKDAFAVIELPTPEATTQTPAEEAGVEATTSAKPETKVSRELAEIYQRHFAKFTSRITVTRKEDNRISKVGFGDRCVWFEGRSADDGKQLYAVVLGEEDLVVALDDGRSAWQLPPINATLKLSQNALSESEGAGCFGLEFYGSIHTDPEDAPPTTRGFKFSELAWAEWFPPEETIVNEDANGRHFSYGNHTMTLDPDGNLVQITGLDPFNHDLTITPMTDKDIERAGDALVQRPNVQPLLIHSADGKEIALASLLKHTFQNKKPDGFVYIPPANGASGLWGCILLTALNDEYFFEKSSLLGKMGTIWALELSSYDQTLIERMDEIEQDALKGPLTAAMLAELAKRLNLLDRSKGYYADAIRLCEADGAIDHDMQRLLSNQTLAGQIAETIDVKSLLSLAIEISKNDDLPAVSMLKTIVTMMPDSNKPKDRRSNMILLSKFAFQSKGQQPFQLFCQQRILEIDEQQTKIAEKKKKKEEAKKR